MRPDAAELAAPLRVAVSGRRSMLWGMGTVPFKTGKVKCSVLYEPDWLGDNRTLFADGAFFQVAIGEPIATHREQS